MGENNHTKHFTIPVFIPHAACPFTCVFCNQKKISSHSTSPTPEETNNIILNHLSTLPEDNAIIEIGFFGGSFTAIPVEEQVKYLEIAADYFEKGKVHGIRISTRPDFIDEKRIGLLKKYGVNTIELGAQSLDDEVLAKSGRNHKAEDVINASVLIKASGVNLGLQMMIGLPADTLEKAKSTAIKIVRLNADCTRIYPTLVIKDTELESLYNSGEYTPLSLEDAIIWTKELYYIFEKSDTKIIRIGLHPSDGLFKGDSLVAGPFHPSFRELVLSNRFKEYAFEPGNKKITIFVPVNQLNHAVGYNSENKTGLIKKYGNIEFKIDHSLKHYSFYVNYN
jgi:histone acetyltransferase (RNA polymerase elongator complex component)